MPLEENPYIVPHLKALIIGWKFWTRQKCGSIVSLWNALLKISILLHNMASGYENLSLAIFWVSMKKLKMTSKFHLLETASTIFQCHNILEFHPFLSFWQKVWDTVLSSISLSEAILGQKMDSKAPCANFFPKRIIQKNFSSIFQLWAKMIAAPPGSRTHIKKTILAAKSGIFKGIKNI